LPSSSTIPHEHWLSIIDRKERIYCELEDEEKHVCYEELAEFGCWAVGSGLGSMRSLMR